MSDTVLADEHGCKAELAGEVESTVAETTVGGDVTSEEEDTLLRRAVEQHDVIAVEAHMAAVRSREGDAGAEDAVNTFDVDGNTLLHLCVVSLAEGAGDARARATSIVALLLEAKANVNDANLLGETPLLLLARSCNPAPTGLADLLLKARAEPEHADDLHGDTALTEAASNGDEGLCKLLLAAGADAMRHSNKGAGQSAAVLAAESGHHGLAALLLQSAALSLQQAARACDAAGIYSLLENLGGEGPACLLLLQSSDEAGLTALHTSAEVAAAGGAAEVARLLLECSAAPDARDERGRTPLAVALEVGIGAQDPLCFPQILATLRVLLEGGSSLESVDDIFRDAEAIMEVAVPPMGSELCALLLEFGDTSDPAGGEGQPGEDQDSNEDEDPLPPAAEETPLEEVSGETQLQLEEMGLPFEGLDVTTAWDLLGCCEALTSMGTKDLRAKCRTEGVPTEDCFEKTDFSDRLRQLWSWQVMPLGTLLREAQRLGLGDMPAEAEHIEAALQESMWGATVHGAAAPPRFKRVTLQRRCQPGAKAKGSRAVEADGGSTNTGAEGQRASGQQEAESESEVDLRLRCAELGLPDLEDLGGEEEAAAELLARCGALTSLSAKELRLRSGEEGVPTDGCLEKAELAGRLRQFWSWRALTLEALQREALAAQAALQGNDRQSLERGLQMKFWGTAARPPAPSPAVPSSSSSSPAAKVGQSGRQPGSREALGFSPQDFGGSCERSEQAQAELNRLEGLQVSDLQRECQQWGIAAEAGSDSQQLLTSLRDVVLWRHLPVSELKRLCQQHGIKPSGEREDVVRQLVASPQRKGSAAAQQANGRASSAENSELVRKEVERLEGSSIGDLKRDFKKWGITLEPGMEKQDMISRLKEVAIWGAMPLTDLQRLCQDRKLETTGVHEELVKRLACGGNTAAAGQESRFKNFFSYGNDPSREKEKEREREKEREKEREAKPQSQKPGPTQQSFTIPGKGTQNMSAEEQEFHKMWEARAAENRKQFASGNRNHAGMPGGQRRSTGMPGSWRVGGSGAGGFPPGFGGGGKPPPPRAPQPPPVDKYFRLLGLPTTATQAEVKKTYRKLALQYHPDKNPGKMKEEAERKFREVTEAYEKVTEHLAQKCKGEKPPA